MIVVDEVYREPQVLQEEREVSISGADICNSAIFASTEFQQVKSAADEESLQHREISQCSIGVLKWFGTVCQLRFPKLLLFNKRKRSQ